MTMRWMLICWMCAGLTARAELVARYVDAADAAFEKPDPVASFWAVAPVTEVALLPQTITTPSKMQASTPSIETRAAHNGRWFAVRVRWADETADRLVNNDLNSDAAAVAFPVGEKNTTSPFMGGPGAPMEIIHWKAVWQRDIEEGYADITDTHPNTAVVLYHGRSNTYEHPLVEMVKSDEALLAMPAIRLGNPVSQVHREQPVEQLAAVGFTGTITTQERQDARARGQYEEGRWTVVFARPLATGDPQDRGLAPGMTHEINFAVWDGASGDVGARKSYSMFVPFRLETKP